MTLSIQSLYRTTNKVKFKYEYRFTIDNNVQNYEVIKIKKLEKLYKIYKI